MRIDPMPFGLLLIGAAALVGCGSDSSDAGGGEASAEGASEASTGPHFAIEGRGESSKTSTVLDVVEGEEASRLTITGSDAEENLIAIFVMFQGLDTVVGSHSLPIGPVAEAEAFAVGTVEGRVYQSSSGQLELSMSSDWHSEGEFEMTLALDESSPLALPPGAPEPAAPAPAMLTLAGTFESEWRVTCRSYVPGFTGGHAVSDSPYCRALAF